MSLRPWNLAPQAVYSLAVYPKEAARSSLCFPRALNICTYVTPITLQPKRYAIALYTPSYTLSCLLECPEADLVLHLLSREQLPLVPVLGQRSGWRFDKVDYLRRHGWLKIWNHRAVLTQTAAYFQLRLGEVREAGDHHLAIMDLVRAKGERAAEDVLTTHHLIEQGVILKSRRARARKGDSSDLRVKARQSRKVAWGEDIQQQ
ncbi:MAG: flavin reductase family protein [Methylacidiphilales bacterium]|nr:flavin reductase family protein [Candidatus Methylacidiphilales bacterium]MDW8349938.1 flavin reductase [Verrucomicrobiae bacterium]